MFVDVLDFGLILCFCFGVGINMIIDVIEIGGLMIVDVIGVLLDVGINCGLCCFEIVVLIVKCSLVEVVE